MLIESLAVPSLFINKIFSFPAVELIVISPVPECKATAVFCVELPTVIVLAVALVPISIAPVLALAPNWIFPPAVSKVKSPVAPRQSISIPPEYA